MSHHDDPQGYAQRRLIELTSAVGGARLAATLPGPRFDITLPPDVLTSWWYELRRQIIALLGIIDSGLTPPPNPLRSLTTEGGRDLHVETIDTPWRLPAGPLRMVQWHDTTTLPGQTVSLTGDEAITMGWALILSGQEAKAAEPETGMIDRSDGPDYSERAEAGDDDWLYE
jgi:hypothetical protein